MAVNLIPNKVLYPISGIQIGCAEAGIRKLHRLDLTLIKISPHASVAGVFTQNHFCAAPVKICKAALEIGHGIRALVINTGIANAGTGKQGLAAAQQTCAAVAKQLNLIPTQVMPFSTGVILEHLPIDKLVAGLPQAVADLSETHWDRAATAIMTTDTQPKTSSRKITLDQTDIHVTGISKGAGMIQPNMATMLGFIATDAQISQPLLEQLTHDITDISFNSITVDGDTSTNDSFIIVATGQAGNPCIDSVEHPHYAPIRDTLRDVAIELAQAIVRDGEGATKFITITVDRAANDHEAREVAYAIANSPLVKTAFFASDPNLGRILAAIGYAKVIDLNVDIIQVWLDDLLVAEKGERASTYQEERANNIMQAAEITIRVVLNRGMHTRTVWTCDFSYDYVKINADYRS